MMCFFRHILEVQQNINMIRCIVHKFDTCTCHSCQNICRLYNDYLLKNQVKCELFHNIDNERKMFNISEKHIKCGVYDTKKYQQSTHTCSTCSMSFRSANSLIAHALQHVEDQSEVCDMCHQSFITKESLKIHVLQMHSKSVIDVSANCEDSFDGKNLLEIYPMHTQLLITEVSGNTYKQKNYLSADTHIRIKEKHNIGTVCENISNQQTDLGRYITQTNDRLHVCKICGQKFDQKYSLKVHICCHREEKPYECTVCGKGFTNKSILSSHIHTHSNQKLYKCSTCEKGFKRKYGLKRHKLTHTNDEFHECTICGKKFRHRHNLLVHIRTHTKEKPYECTICGKRFRQTPNLKGHIQTHTKEKPYECTICGKRFGQTSNLKGHILTHTTEKPYTCTLCDKRFAQNCYLKAHIRTHSSEKPHECMMCGKRFKIKCRLRRHSLIHKNDTL